MGACRARGWAACLPSVFAVPVNEQLYMAARQRRWSPFTKEWDSPEHELHDAIKAVGRAGRVRVAQELKKLPWPEFISLLSDAHVDAIARSVKNFKKLKLRDGETFLVFMRRIAMEYGRGSRRVPQVPFTDDEQRRVTWSGKRKMTAEDHRKADRIHVHYTQKAYTDKLKDYQERCRVNNRTPLATYHLIQPSLSTEQMKRKLNKLICAGTIRKAPVSCTYFRFNALIGYNTDEVYLVPARSLSCSQAALVAATGCSIDELGIPLQDPKDKKGLSFNMLNNILKDSSGFGRLFILMNESSKDHELDSAVDVFSKKEGVYIIHSYYHHPEDVGFSHAEPIHHYIVYNAGTRVLFLYPEVRA
mmetsp:Transcript_20505/g.51180  ORF Transcript_20505/g.51180 Transcript_20505/m.51180 type:complete len:360 (+) Transcript_20505:77-1156(+)